VFTHNKDMKDMGTILTPETAHADYSCASCTTIYDGGADTPGCEIGTPDACDHGGTGGVET